MTATRDRRSDPDEADEPAWDDRPIIGSFVGLPWWGAVVLAFVASALGAVVDMQRQDTLGLIYQGTYAVSCGLAVCAVRRRSLFGPMVQPPLVFAVTAVGGILLFGDDPASGGLKQLIFTVAIPLTSNFPTMAVTTGVTVAIGLFRLWWQRDPAAPARPGRPGKDRADRADRGDRAGRGGRAERAERGLDRGADRGAGRGRGEPDEFGDDPFGRVPPDRPQRDRPVPQQRTPRGRQEPPPRSRTAPPEQRGPDPRSGGRIGPRQPRGGREGRPERREPPPPRADRGRGEPPSGDRTPRGGRGRGRQPEPPPRGNEPRPRRDGGGAPGGREGREGREGRDGRGRTNPPGRRPRRRPPEDYR